MVRRDQRGQRRRIGGDHQLVGRCAAQRQAWHALRCVLVGERVVAPGIGRLRNAPGHVVRLGERDLLAHRRVTGIAQRAAVRFVEHQAGHQVLEHRTRPRAQAGLCAHGVERPPERGPVAHRHVALGDGEQAGQARLRGQQVVETGVELLLGHAVADVKEVPLAVVQEAEIGAPGQLLEVGGQGLQALAGRARVARFKLFGCGLHVSQGRAQGGQVVAQQPRQLGGVGQQGGQVVGGLAQQEFERVAVAGRLAQGVAQGHQAGQRGVAGVDVGEQLGHPGHQRGQPLARRGQGTQHGARVIGRAGQLEAGLGGGQQVPAQIAAVHGGHIHGQQRRAALGVVPVEKVAAVALQRVQGSGRGLQAREQVLRADPAEAARAGHAEQVQADVGGRGAVRHHVVRHGLQVVRWQVPVFGDDAALEQAPGVACQAFQRGMFAGWQLGFDAARVRAADPPRPHRRGGPQQAQQHRQHRVRRAGGQQADQQQQRERGCLPVDAGQVGQLGLGRGLCGGAGRPLHQVTLADQHAVERAQDRIQPRQRVVQQLRHVPQPGECGTGQVGCGLAVEVQLGDVGAAGGQACRCAHQRPGTKGRQHEQQRRPGRHERACEREQQQGQ